MSEAENVEIVKLLYAGFDKGDIPSLLDTLADDVDWNVPTIDAVPWARPRRGRKEVGQYFADYIAAEEPQELRRNEFVAQGDRVVVHCTLRSRVKSTGRVYETPFVHFWTIRGGKAQDHQSMLDTAVVAEAHRA